MGQTPFYRTASEMEHHFMNINILERVHLLVIEFDHPIFGFERSNIELLTLFAPSLQVLRLYGSK